MMRDRWDGLFEDEGEDIRALMGSEDVEPGLEKGDGFYISHEVRVTEPWRESRVSLDERPRVKAPTSAKTCAHCGQEFKGSRQARYCGGACQRAAHRARTV